LDPLEQRAVFAYLLSTAARTSDRAGISSQSQADLYALEMLRDPRPLIRALLKTADHVAFETAASPELQTEIATAIENLHTSQDVLDVVRRLSDLAASKAAASSRRMLGLPWQELPLPPGIAVTGWGPPSACLFRARKLAEVSGTEGAFTLAEGHGKRPSWIEAPAMSQLGAAAAAQHRST
ncbi:MAG: hypothetical protein U1E22_08785, partial [Coriobacteriia bacterium]|nr:hypothetical protein [Coriobacteriia bacterium]